MGKVLEIENLTKLYSSGRGAENISFSIDEGDIVGILGPNGSGKTTIMKAIIGLTHMTSGSVKIFSYDIENEFEKAMAEVGCLIEAPAFYDNMSAYKNLKIMSQFYSDIDDERIRHMLDIVGLARYADSKPVTFSLGMKQRLGIALALLSRPKFLVLDEPVNGLDIEGMVEMREIITGLSKKYGTTFLISSHLAKELELTCNKIVIMHEGKMVKFATMEEALISSPSLEEYFLSQVRDIRKSVSL